MILLLDNYDSFTFNLYQMIPKSYKVKVIRNDQITVDEIKKLPIDGIILSPGPGHPKNAGNMIDIIQNFHKNTPILGICLGHQALAEALGGKVDFAGNIRHGKQSICKHEGKGILNGMKDEFVVMRYHSLSVKQIPTDFEAISHAVDDGELMIMQHKTLPLIGIQYHPESIGTEIGMELINRFLQICESNKVVV